MMEPNDQYLCIVANRSGNNASAEDTKITDTTITRQINKGQNISNDDIKARLIASRAF